MKTVKGAAKRFKKTGNGIKRKHAFKRHLLSCKSPKSKRQLRRQGQIAMGDLGSVKLMIG